MNPVLYILMRNDLDSMNPGKACAQAAHAANQFVELNRDDPFVKEWQNSTIGGFGTTLVFGAPKHIVEDISDAIEKIFGYENVMTERIIRGIVNDPTYPVKDGQCTHYISVDTCAYMFGDRDQLYKFIERCNLKLMP